MRNSEIIRPVLLAIYRSVIGFEASKTRPGCTPTEPKAKFRRDYWVKSRRTFQESFFHTDISSAAIIYPLFPVSFQWWLTTAWRLYASISSLIHILWHVKTVLWIRNSEEIDRYETPPLFRRGLVRPRKLSDGIKGLYRSTDIRSSPLMGAWTEHGWIIYQTQASQLKLSTNSCSLPSSV